MSSIDVFYHNEVYFYIESSDYNTLKKIQNRFMFYSPNRFYSKKFQNRQWDGKIRLFKLNKKLFPVGLFYELKKFCKYNKIKININRSTLKHFFNKINEKKAKKYIYNIIKDEFLNDIKDLYEHQMKSAISAIKNKRGIFNIHTGGGKSLIIYILLKFLFDRYKNTDSQIVLIVDQKSLADQLASEFKDFCNDEEFLDWISVFHSDSKNKDINSKLIVTTYSSFNNNKQIYKNVKGVIVDEAHTAKAKTLKDVLSYLSNAEYRFGFTGSFPSNKLEQNTIKSVLGKILYNKELMKSVNEGIITDFYIYNIVYDYMNDEQRMTNAYSDYSNFQYNIGELEDRPKILYKLYEDKILDKTDNLFIIFFRLNTLKLFEKYIKKNLDFINLYKMTGNVKSITREKYRKEITNNPNSSSVVLGTYKIIRSGINIRNLNGVVYADTFKKDEGILQSIGRSVRNYKDKEYAKIIDLIDYTIYKQKTGYSIKHFKEKLKFYNEKNFKYKVLYYKKNKNKIEKGENNKVNKFVKRIEEKY